LLHEVDLGQHVDVRQLEPHHGRQAQQHHRDEFGAVRAVVRIHEVHDRELRRPDKWSASSNESFKRSQSSPHLVAELLQLLQDVVHALFMRVQLHLSRKVEQQVLVCTNRVSRNPLLERCRRQAAHLAAARASPRASRSCGRCSPCSTRALPAPSTRVVSLDWILHPCHRHRVRTAVGAELELLHDVLQAHHLRDVDRRHVREDSKRAHQPRPSSPPQQRGRFVVKDTRWRKRIIMHGQRRRKDRLARGEGYGSCSLAGSMLTTAASRPLARRNCSMPLQKVVLPDPGGPSTTCANGISASSLGLLACLVAITLCVAWSVR
jgi:hypothetical protein